MRKEPNPLLKLSVLLTVFLLPCIIYTAAAQQLPDTVYRFANLHPAYSPGAGPLILVDGAHNNFHKKPGGFIAFCNLLEGDGYRTGEMNSPVSDPGVFKGCRILVIANALDSSNTERWMLPTPSAFTKAETGNIEEWVRNGGSLLLVADHMPFAGAVTELAGKFGFRFVNGFAITGNRTWPPSEFSVRKNTLLASPPVTGTKEDERIDSVATFTGSAFSIPRGAAGVLRFDTGNLLQPDTAWKFNNKTPSVSLKGYFQGAIMNYGKGKIAVFGEAAMFTAQVVNGSFRVGINSETAPQNARFVLNLIHWLDKP